MVTRSLVSYDFGCLILRHLSCIEWSPDHWWVTTLSFRLLHLPRLLNGHQIIGELRLEPPWFIKWALYWMVTRSLVSYDDTIVPTFNRLNWMVTRSLVSYDSLRSEQLKLSWYWMVTRSLVSYDAVFCPFIINSHNWMVTRSLVSYDISN